MRKNLGFVSLPPETKKRQVRVGITWRRLGPSTHPKPGDTRVNAYRRVTHLTTYGGPLVKGVSSHASIVESKD